MLLALLLLEVVLLLLRSCVAVTSSLYVGVLYFTVLYCTVIGRID